MENKMQLSKDQLFLLCQSAISAAYQAGRLIRKYSSKEIKISKKENAPSLATSVVTEVDIKSEELIKKVLISTCKIFDLALLTEESIDDKSRFEKDYFWCIDPLDGTLPFTESRPGYAVSIALVSREGVPQIGVVYDPVNEDLYSSIIGQGATLNGSEIKLNHLNESSVLNVFFDRSFFTGKLFESTKNELSKLGYEKVEINQAGGSVMSALSVLKNCPACYFKYPRETDSGGSIWDYASTSCIFTELSLINEDIFGGKLDLNRRESTFMNHKGFIYASDAEIASKVRNLYKSLI